ncbi:MAG: class I SAM-dependent methyltransferase [Betaproteobacteria bacterium]|nr:class I SAM-dependent methyltransferase [Betaproteobacteria bacterium]
MRCTCLASRNSPTAGRVTPCRRSSRPWLRIHATAPPCQRWREPGSKRGTSMRLKPLYGKQEGAVVGYNPHKPGRPSHAYHTYQMAGLRLMLNVTVAPGNQESLKRMMERAGLERVEYFSLAASVVALHRGYKF